MWPSSPRGRGPSTKPRDGKCEKVEEYRAGDAWVHPVHRHLGAVQGNEPAEITLFGFNMKHGEPDARLRQPTRPLRLLPRAAVGVPDAAPVASRREGISMRKLPGLFSIVTAIAVLATVNAASATPPSGQFSYTEHGRVQQAADTTVTIPAADNVSNRPTRSLPAATPAGGRRTGDAVTRRLQGRSHRGPGAGAAPAQEVAAGRHCRRSGREVPPPQRREPAGTVLTVSSSTCRSAGRSPSCPRVRPSRHRPAPASRPRPSPRTGFRRRTRREASSRRASTTVLITSGTVVHSLASRQGHVRRQLHARAGFQHRLDRAHRRSWSIITKGTLAIYEAHDGKCAKVEEYTRRRGVGPQAAPPHGRERGVGSRRVRASSGST